MCLGFLYNFLGVQHRRSFARQFEYKPLFRRRLLLRHAVKRTQSPDKIPAMNPTDGVFREGFGKNAQRLTIVRIVERRYQHNAVGDVEIRIARRQPLTIEDNRSRHR